MVILNVAYPFAPVSLDSVGGAEQILALLDRHLVRRGHASIVIAAPGSKVEGELIAPEGAADSPEFTYARWRDAIGDALRSCSIDLVHLHGVDFQRYLPPEDTPCLATLHLPRSFYPENVLLPGLSRMWFNCVSKTQLESFPLSPRLVGAIANGVPLDLLRVPNRPPGNYVLAMGRICPEKGFHFALDAAERAGVPLYLAGQLFPYPDHVRYWRDVLQLRLVPPHRFLGALGLRDKASVVSAARCLLVTSLVPETSSLTAMESLACGTPVVAFPCGALPELVDSGKNGFLVPDVPAMAEAIQSVPQLDRRLCRSTARRLFSATRMADEYIQLYAHLIGQSAPPLGAGAGSVTRAFCG